MSLYHLKSCFSNQLIRLNEFFLSLELCFKIHKANRDLLTGDVKPRKSMYTVRIQTLRPIAGPLPFHIFIIFLIWTLVAKLHDNEV